MKSGKHKTCKPKYWTHNLMINILLLHITESDSKKKNISFFGNHIFLQQVTHQY